MKHHLAIMNPKFGFIEKIVNCSKTIESRWYKNRIAPWDRINKGDRVYFKDSGKQVTAVADVSKVIQFEGLNRDIFSEIVSKYGDDIGLIDRSYSGYYKSKNYVVLIGLTNARYLKEPFDIDKTGYGTGCAWIIVDNIDDIRAK